MASLDVIIKNGSRTENVNSENKAAKWRNEKGKRRLRRKEKKRNWPLHRTETEIEVERRKKRV